MGSTPLTSTKKKKCLFAGTFSCFYRRFRAYFLVHFDNFVVFLPFQLSRNLCKMYSTRLLNDLFSFSAMLRSFS